MAVPTGRVVRVVDLDAATPGEVASAVEAVPGADLVVMVASAGAEPQAAPVIGRACSDHRVMTATVIVRGPSAGEEALSRTLAVVRPWSLMVVVASDGSYVDAILGSLR